MYGDEKISVKTYHDKLKTLMLLVLYVLSFHMHNSKWGYDVSTWELPRKAWIDSRMLEMWVFLAAIKKIFVARQI